ncbi:sporulation protein [Streptomyces sp. NPDC059578]|uniref:sporulation protein n=1 Tax=Streptomyces sp. NPDC059578 TaxID=3346874 RepID=UPI0036A75B09
MVFKRLLGSIGIGGPTVDTVLNPGPVRPGSTLTGEVRLKGGDGDVTVDITLELLARVEVETDGGEGHGDVAFDRYAVSEDLRLPAGEPLTVPFSLTLPWETPVTELYGQSLGIVLGVRTEVAVAGSRDKGDLDPLTVRPLPAQEAVLEAFGQLGFGFVSADLEYGRIGGTSQVLPFYQEIEISPAPRYAHALKEVEVTFLAAPHGMDVVLEADRRGHHHGGEALYRFPVSYEDVDRTDWNTAVGGWVEQLVHAHPPYAGSGASAHPGGHHEDHGHRSGPGTGAVVAAGAAGLAVGVAGGLVAAEVVDEVGDLFENEEGDEDG